MRTRLWLYELVKVLCLVRLKIFTPAELFLTAGVALSPERGRAVGLSGFMAQVAAQCGTCNCTPERSATMAQGTVKWFNPEKGFGFIAADGGGADVFVHFSAIADTGGYRSLDENQRVEFETTVGPKGTQAESVRVL